MNCAAAIIGHHLIFYIGTLKENPQTTLLIIIICVVSFFKFYLWLFTLLWVITWKKTKGVQSTKPAEHWDKAFLVDVEMNFDLEAYMGLCFIIQTILF